MDESGPKATTGTEATSSSGSTEIHPKPKADTPPSAGSVAAAIGVFALIGLALGFWDLRGRLDFLRDRLDTLRDLPPTPNSVFWIESLRAPASLLDSLERPLLALFLVLLLLGLWAAARVLAPGLRILKPASPDGPTGAAAHLEVPQVIRAAVAAGLTLWISGLLAPASALMRSGSVAVSWVAWLSGGIPAWSHLFAGDLRWLAHSVALGVSIWWIWGPRGLLARDRDTPLPRVIGFGVMAGFAMLPAVAALYEGRLWLRAMAEVQSVADGAAWRPYFTFSVLLPTAACAILAVCAYLFRPRPASAFTAACLGVAAIVAQVGGWAGLRLAGNAAERYDLYQRSLARALNLQPSPFRRLCLLLAPEGRFGYTIVEDGSNGGPDDRIACNGATVDAAAAFLRARNYRSALAFRAFDHLHACASIDWLDSRNLQLSLQMLETNPNPIAAGWLMRKLSTCPTTDENRAILDAVADPARFTWPKQDGARRLAALYSRFGDVARVRSYIASAGLNEAEVRSALGGIQPLADGSVRGRVTVRGAPVEAVRVGLVAVGDLKQLQGPSLPNDWGLVLTSSNTDRDGRYSFSHIPQGEYALVVTGGGIGARTSLPMAVPHPGTVLLDRFHAQVEVPEFDIRFTARPIPVTPPAANPGGTIAQSPAPPRLFPKPGPRS